ncbi:Rha family transcriptional regulator [Methylobacterium sp. Leaf111]|uniref:Rha family transcriptional regulator n=1 Tax=Methylobacterium sp. Leaf111 TaxID=1736257 RepID=UPI0009EC1728
MNILTPIPNGLTMSSLEIAERTGKRHDHVMRDIRTMLKGLGITGPSFGGSYRDSTGRSLPCFNLPKRETLILVSGYSVTMRAEIIDRWQELEAQQAPRIPTHVEALRLARPQALRVNEGKPSGPPVIFFNQWRPPHVPPHG